MVHGAVNDGGTPLAQSARMVRRNEDIALTRCHFWQVSVTSWQTALGLVVFLLGQSACNRPPPAPQTVTRLTSAPLGGPDLPDLDAMARAVASDAVPPGEDRPVDGVATEPGTIEDPSGHALDAFFAGLAHAEAQSATDGRVAIVQFGDSHTAGDAFTGRLRQRLQRRFGDAGRGFLLPGHPFAGYLQEDAKYGSSGAWKAENGLYRTARGPIGMSGFRVYASSSNATAWVGTCASCPAGRAASRLEILYRKVRDGGQLAYQIDDGAWELVDTRADDVARRDDAVVLHVTDGPHKLTVRPVGNGAVDVVGLVLERDRPGVVVDALGMVSARAAHLHGWDWDVVGAQLALRDPRLVIFAYGTNEADCATDPARLEQQLVDMIERARRAAPHASFLVLGPPDMAKPVRSTGGRRGWHTPAALPRIIEAERRAAFRAGAAFFDQYHAMGGGNVADRMHAQKLFARDRVHMTSRGYRLAADLLLDALLDAYDQ